MRRVSIQYKIVREIHGSATAFLINYGCSNLRNFRTPKRTVAISLLLQSLLAVESAPRCNYWRPAPVHKPRLFLINFKSGTIFTHRCPHERAARGEVDLISKNFFFRNSFFPNFPRRSYRLATQPKVIISYLQTADEIFCVSSASNRKIISDVENSIRDQIINLKLAQISFSPSLLRQFSSPDSKRFYSTKINIIRYTPLVS